MPPKKKQTPTELRELIHNHGIRFKGPVPPRMWPIEFSHHFQAIRDIEKMRYDDYKRDPLISKEKRKYFKERVHHITMLSYNLLDDVAPNEATWRVLEDPIFERFKGYVICQNCGDEIWKADFEANFRDEVTHEKLAAKRAVRSICVCKHKKVASKKSNSDVEYQTIFDYANDQGVNHAPGDNIQGLSISMKPDLVIGLRAPDHMSHDPIYFPVTGKQRLLLPFLVTEAKREGKAPGFRAIQIQTAFPIRRFLKAQYHLSNSVSTSELCLVWFLAYQGEQWRLHAAIYDDDQVKIYDLWQGTIQSQDGALQLLLIIDYIWSWARDIYRPTVKELLFKDRRDTSPESIYRHQQSVFSSTASPTPTLAQFEWMAFEQDLAGGVQASRIPEDATLQLENRIETNSEVDSSLDSFPWAVGYQSTPCWAMAGIIRHANVADFEYKLIKHVGNTTMPFNKEQKESILYLQSQSLFILPVHVRRISALWTKTSTRNFTDSPNEIFQVTFCFRTYCDSATWQIRKVLICIIWRKFLLTSHDAGSLPGYVAADGERKAFPIGELEDMILGVQKIRGKQSIDYAIQRVNMILTPRHEGQHLVWSSYFTAHDLYDKRPEFVEIESLLKRFLIERTTGSEQRSQIHSVLEQQQQQQQHNVPFSQATHAGKSMLTVRGPSMSRDCPLYCLFVMHDKGKYEKTEIYQLLEEAIAAGKFCGELGREFSWETLNTWRAAVKRWSISP